MIAHRKQQQTWCQHYRAKEEIKSARGKKKLDTNLNNLI